MAAPLNGSLVGAALVSLAGLCDGASSWDGKGFSGADVEFGHDVAKKFLMLKGFVSEKQHSAVKRLCHKYRKQLAAAGFEQEALQAEAFTTNPEAQAARADAAAHREAGRLARSARVVRTVTFIGETAAAFKAFCALRRTEWLPKSQLTVLRRIDVRTKNGKMLAIAEVEMPGWLAEAKGAIQPAMAGETWEEAARGFAEAQGIINAG